METLRYVVLANGLLAVVSIAYYVLLRRETFFGTNRLALWLGLAASLGLPLLELPDWRPQPVRTVMQRTAQVIVPRVLPGPTVSDPDVTITFPNGDTYRALLGQSAAASGWSWQRCLVALYVVVLLALLVRFARQLASLRRLIRQSPHDPYEDFTLVRNETITSPFSFFGWVVLNPASHEPDELDQILRHERVHVRERHSVDLIVAELICIVLWFNPAVYLFRHLIHQTLEFSADRAVLAEGVDARSYQYNLVKVSLSAGQSPVTNHFSQSQLKSRIVMINRPKSTDATWLKYPVLLLTALTVTTLFAHPKTQTLAAFMPKSVAHVAATGPGTERANAQSTSADTGVFTESVKTRLIDAESSIIKATVMADTISKQVSAADPVRISPSRYIRYEGDRLYWIITPKTSFDDLAIMKQEFERHGYKMQVQALTYDPLFSYITDIKITIIRPVAGVSDFEETAIAGKPIRSYGGFNGLNTLKDVAVVGSYPFNENVMHLPQGLVQTVRNEELSVTKFIHDSRLNYLVATGRKISSTYAPTSSTYNVSGLLTRPDMIKKYGITLNADSTLEISGDHLPVFINNELIAHEDLKRVNIKRLSTLISSEEWGKNGQPGAVKALLFYTNEPK